MNEVFNPTESRREFLSKAPARVFKLGVALSLPALIIEACGSNSIDQELKSEVDSAVSVYKGIVRDGFEGTKGVTLTQYALETGSAENIEAFYNRLKQKINPEESIISNLAYLGVKHDSSHDVVSRIFQRSRSLTSGEGIASDFTAISLRTDKDPEQIALTYNQVSNFSHMNGFFGLDSTDAVASLTSLACEIEINATREIYDEVNDLYHGDRTVPRVTLTLSSYISGDPKKTLSNLDAVNAFNFGIFSIYEQNKALLTLASSTGAYSISQTLSMFQYLGSVTGFGEADRARLILAMACAKTKTPLLSRKFYRQEGKISEDQSSAVLA